MPQGRIPDKFTILGEPREEAKPLFFFFLFNNPPLQLVHAIYKIRLKIGKYKKHNK